MSQPTDDQLFEMRAEEAEMQELGLTDPDEPSRYRHIVEHRRLMAALTAEFTPRERMILRYRNGLVGRG